MPSDEAMQRLLGSIPAKRLAAPDEIAATAAFLASAHAAYIAGQTILVDGGAVAGSM